MMRAIKDQLKSSIVHPTDILAASKDGQTTMEKFQLTTITLY
jgi:hypothetical protein